MCKGRIKKKIYLCLFYIVLIPAALFAKIGNTAMNIKLNAIITPQVFELAKKNENWKLAYITGKDAQIVFMNVTSKTNPNNEIGMETHKFDQVIFVVEGHAKSILNGKTATVNVGDMIFIPQGVAHNFVNLDANVPFKIVSIYSAMDIPEDSIYKTKADTPND